MKARVIRADYDDLAKIAATFEQQVSSTRSLLAQLRQQQATLEGGDWLGLGAHAFYGEMNFHVVPTISRLIGALEQAASTTRQMGQIMHQAEIDAAALFRIDGAAGTAGFNLASAAAGGDGSNGEPQDVQSEPGTPPGTATVSGGTPFARGAGDTDDISPNDVSQGQLGDCGLMSSLAAIAQVNPDVIRNMIRDNGDGSYTVTFKINVGDPLETLSGKHMADYNKEHGIPDWLVHYPYGANPMAGTVLKKEIRVTPDFPADGSGQPIYAHYGDSAGGKPEIWVPLIEKAYAQMRGDYSDMNGINPGSALSNITGKASMVFTPDEMKIDEMADFQAKGNAIVMDTPPYTTEMALIGQVLGRYSIVPNHAYFVTNVDKAAGTVSLRNPWGWSNPEVTLSYDEFNKIFTKGYINPTR